MMYKDVNSMYSVDEMMQILASNNAAFDYCYQYFIEDVERRSFYENFIRPKKAEGYSEREAYSYYMATWIPQEPRPDRIMERIKAFME